MILAVEHPGGPDLAPGGPGLAPGGPGLAPGGPGSVRYPVLGGVALAAPGK